MFHAKVMAKRQLPLLKRWHSYNGRTMYLCDGESAHISNYWNEGNKAIPVLFNPHTMQPFASFDKYFTRQTIGNPYNAEMGTLKLEPGIALVEHVYSGIRQYLRVTLHPADFAALKSDWI